MAYRPTPTSYYYSGQGRIGIGDRDPSTGAFNNVFYPGNVTSVSIDIAVTKFEHKESMTGTRGIDLTIIQEKNATFKITAETQVKDFLSLGVYGTSGVEASGTVTGEAHKVKRGMVIPLKHQKVTSVVVNKAGSPVTQSGNYEVDNDYGVIYVLAAAAGLADNDDVTINYSYGGTDTIEAFTQATPPEKYLRFEGLNTVDGSMRLIEIPRAAFEPITGMELINEELGTIELNGNILPDLTITATDKSRYFRERRFVPA